MVRCLPINPQTDHDLNHIKEGKAFKKTLKASKEWHRAI